MRYVRDSVRGGSRERTPLAGEEPGGDSGVAGTEGRSGAGFLGSSEVDWTLGSICVGMGSRVPADEVDFFQDHRKECQSPTSGSL